MPSPLETFALAQTATVFNRSKLAATTFIPADLEIELLVVERIGGQKPGRPLLYSARDRVELVSVRRFNFGSAESKWLEKRHPQQNFVLPTIWTAARRHACGLRPWELLFTIRNRRSLRLVLVRAVNCFKMPCASTESCPGALSLAARCAVKLAVPSGSQAKPTRGRSPAKQTLIWRGSDSIESFHEPVALAPVFRVFCGARHDQFS